MLRTECSNLVKVIAALCRLGMSVVLGYAEHQCSTSGADLNLNKKIHSRCVLWPQKRFLSVILLNF